MILSSFYTYLKLFLAGLDLKTFKSSYERFRDLLTNVQKECLFTYFSSGRRVGTCFVEETVFLTKS
jgi:hypothetical protein